MWARVTVTTGNPQFGPMVLLFQCFTIINARMRADRGVIHYGDTVSLNSVATRCLGYCYDGVRSFWRALQLGSYLVGTIEEELGKPLELLRQQGIPLKRSLQKRLRLH